MQREPLAVIIAKPPRNVSLDAAPFALVGRICRTCKGPRTRGASHDSINSGLVLGVSRCQGGQSTPLPPTPRVGDGHECRKAFTVADAAGRLVVIKTVIASARHLQK